MIQQAFNIHIEIRQVIDIHYQEGISYPVEMDFAAESLVSP